MPDCPACGMSYTSPLAAAECADMDREEEARLQRALRVVHRRACPYQVTEGDEG